MDFSKIKNSKLPEIIAFVLFIIVAVIALGFHEVWFDEIYAFFLAAGNSVSDLLFVIPKYEGHPPLWHLILKCFTIFNIEPDIILKSVSLIFAGAAIYLLEFKSDFPRIVKLLLPFTYFILWHGCIVARPYSMLMFAMFLSAITYKDRNEHPFRFMSSLVFVALCSLYGTVISAGIAISWLFDIQKEYGKNLREFLKNCLSDRRVLSIILTGFVALLIVLDMVSVNLPKHATNIESYGLFYKLTYIYLGIPAELFFSKLLTDLWIDLKSINITFFILTAIAGAMIILVFVYLANISKKKYTFLFTWFLTCTFALIGYICARHLVVFVLILVWFLWIFYQEGYSLKVIENKIVRYAIAIVLMIGIGFNLFWSAKILQNDYKYSYYVAKDLVNYIKQNEVDNYRVLFTWTINFTEDKENKSLKMVSDVYYSPLAPVVSPFFKKDFIYSFLDIDGKRIKNIRFADQKNSDKLLKNMAKQTLPDFIIGPSDWGECLSAIYDTDIYFRQYSMIYIFTSNYLFKSSINAYPFIAIYIRKDLKDDFRKRHPNAVMTKDEFRKIK